MAHRSEQIRIFVEEIWQWYSVHKRSLPWRDLAVSDDTERAYRILVSEIMLQQTQVERVKVIYTRFLESFPTLAGLANASNAEVIVAWRGMGYNSRALRLRDAARTIIERYGGVFPHSMEELLAIKGIGPYTAAAIRNFAFNLPTSCIDTNIRRILHRTFIGPENRDGTWRVKDDDLLKLASAVLDAALKCQVESIKCQEINCLGTLPFVLSPSEWHAALMDFGSLVCTKTNPKWGHCPLTKRGMMKAAYKVRLDRSPVKTKEPGRLVGSAFIPNRIFRGRIIEELRDEARGLSPDEIGRRICIDWSPAEHRAWLKGILRKLKDDQLIIGKNKTYTLS